MEEKILASLDSPKELEFLYRENPDLFQKIFPEIYSKYPDSLILKVWQERLNFSENKIGINQNRANQRKTILLVGLLAAIVGTIVQLPIYFEKIDLDWFYSRNLAGVFIVSLMIYFFSQKPQAKKMILIVIGATIGAWLYLAILPYKFEGSHWELRKNFRAFYDAIAIAELHIPVFLWLILGVVFTGKNWRSAVERMNFLKYNGELIVYTTMIIMSGGILTGITLFLLDSIEKSYKLSDWYMEHIAPYIFSASPLIATFLIDKVIEKRFNIAHTLARIFVPLFLITTISYLIVMAVYRQNLFIDREYLIAFNILLIVVLGLLIFSIAERDSEVQIGISDYMNIGLVLTTIVIDLIALVAVVSRTAGDINGLTPNRAAILGLNLLVFIHLVGILYNYVRFAIKKDAFVKLRGWITGYLPTYIIWSLTISILFPLIFWYR